MLTMTKNQKGGPSPPFSREACREAVARAELSTPPGQKNYFFFAFLAFFAFFAFFAFLAIVSSQGFNGLKRDTRGMLGGGPASQNPRLTTQQIRGALPSRCHADVIALSTAVMHFRVLFAENARRCMPALAPIAVHERYWCGTRPIGAPWLTPSQRNLRFRLHQFKTTTRFRRVG